MYRFFFVLLSISFLLSCNKQKKVVIIHPDGFYKEVYHVIDDSIKDGSYLKYYSNDVLADSCQYVADQIHGTRKIYDPEGILEIEETYVNGQFHGPYKTFYPNGQVKKIQQYIDNKIQGKVTQYFPNGSLKAEVVFIDNLENGPFSEYHENGNLHWEGFYQGGDNEQDTLKEYDQTGILIRKLYCENGICQTVWTPEKGFVETKEIFTEN